MMMVRVIYDTTDDCNDCLFNIEGFCDKLSKPITDIVFEKDCPLPKLSIVEKYTRYIRADKGLDCCGNCKYWTFWHYNKHFKKDMGACTRFDGVNVLVCTSLACKEFDSV